MNCSKIASHPHLPNIITLARLLAIPFIVITMTICPGGEFWVSVVCSLVYAVAAVTDILDGHLARKYNLVTNLGKFLDPLVDKLLVASALIMLIPLGRVPAWVVFLILAREIAVTGLRAIASERGLVISASDSAKKKTLAQNIALVCLLWHYSFFWADMATIGMVILYVALAITYWSGGLYFYYYLKAVKNTPAAASPKASAINDPTINHGLTNPTDPTDPTNTII